ncbi:MAG: protein kinase domain-containing protein, partial [Gemmataceae bacterium]
MAPGESPSSVAACPSADDLRAYGLGRLPLPRLEAVAEHIDDCPACQATLRGLQDGSDTLVSQLRRLAPPKIPAEDETRTASGEQSATAVSTDSDRDEVVWAGRKRLGEYELLEPLGGGGMGLVFRARQVPLNLIVALKVIRTGDFASPAEKARFRTEGEAIARLKHPNVVQVHHFGEADGLPYFSMEFLNGGSLSRRLADEPMPARPAAELVRTLALAVQAAHYQKIVHRDLKPGNVLLAADGTPKISDFGLAKLLDADSGQTATSAAIGTPTYMAPEQARADGSDVGFAVDIYALGVILYQALVGHPPFRGATPAATMELVKTQPVPPPTQEQPALSRDLEAVCLKCLEKDPAKRYASARDLADDLDNWLDLRPTRARPRNRLDRTLLAMRRRPRLTALAAACLLAGVATATALHYTDRDR